MKIAILDTNGAGIGQAIIKKIYKENIKNIYIIALGTNSYATSKMVKSGANVGISGERSICDFCKTNKIDAVISTIDILIRSEDNQELTPMICKYIINMSCKKYILPMKKNNIYIPNTSQLQIKDMIEDIVSDIKTITNIK